MSWRHIVNIALTFAVIVSAPVTVAADEPCPDNCVANASFEEGSHSAGDVGALPSSIVANGWTPWSLWGYSQNSRQAEFDLENITRLGRYSTYRVHSGNHSQKFSTVWATHQAGVYQRIAIPRGSEVTFSICVQIYTGEEVLTSHEEFISDLEKPGNYRVYVGIDPNGDEPPGFGSPPSERTVWSEPVIDRDTRQSDSPGMTYDAWVRIEVTTKAQSDHVTIFTKGQPEFPVRHNVSYWDDACLTFVPPMPVPTATPQFTRTPVATQTPTYTPTPEATLTPAQTLSPTDTPLPTQTPPLRPTETLPPTQTSAPATSTPSSTPPPTKAAGQESSENPLLLFIFAAVWLSAVAHVGWSLWKKRHSPSAQPGA